MTWTSAAMPGKHASSLPLAATKFHSLSPATGTAECHGSRGTCWIGNIDTCLEMQGDALEEMQTDAAAAKEAEQRKVLP